MNDSRVPAFVELQRSLLHADTPVEFRAMLEKIKVEARLSFGQISTRSGASRSSMHSLTSTKFESLPSRDLVVKFIAGCSLSKKQADIVLGLHHKLELELDQKLELDEERNKTSVASTTASANEVVASKLRTDLMQVLREGGQWSVSEHGDGDPRVINIQVRQAPPRRNSETPHVVADLWRWTLSDARRVRRAVQVLLAVTLLVLVIGTLLVFLIRESPTIALSMAVVFAVLSLFTTAARRRRFRLARDDDS